MRVEWVAQQPHGKSDSAMALEGGADVPWESVPGCTPSKERRMRKKLLRNQGLVFVNKYT